MSNSNAPLAHAPQYAAMGIPIIALAPGTKIPFKEMEGWQHGGVVREAVLLHRHENLAPYERRRMTVECVGNRQVARVVQVAVALHDAAA